MAAKRVLLGCCAIAIALPGPGEWAAGQAPLPGAARVQSANQREQNAPAAPDEAARDAAARKGTVEEVVVTANRRTERLHDVPVTVTVVDGRQLTRQNISAVEDIARAAPALNQAGPPGFGALSIRGIGGLSFSRSTEGSVGVVIDDVSLANTSNNPPLLFDISRAEVLEGPQSTLFGRNASAGVINIVTNAPDSGKFQTILHTDMGTENNIISRGAVNIPLGPNAALRVAGGYDQSPEVQRNLADGSFFSRQTRAGRARFQLEPNDRLKLNLSADYSETNVEGGAPWVIYSVTPGSLLSARLRACGVQVGTQNQQGCVNPSATSTQKAYGTSVRIDYNLGGPTLSSITALRWAENPSLTDADSTTAYRVNQAVSDRTRNVSQELRLVSPNSGTIEYVAGLYYFTSNLSNVTTQIGQILTDLPSVGQCPLPAFLCGITLGQRRPIDTHIKSYAGFGQFTIHAAPQLRLILGGRVGNENVEAASGASNTAQGAVAQFAPASALRANPQDTYFSYRAGVQYDLTQEIMAFGTYTRGYKGPAVNDGATSANVPLVVKPEIPKSGEIGVKANLAGGRLALNATAFYTEVTNFQAQFFDSSLGGAFIYGNAPELTSKGVTMNLFGRPLPGLVANLGATYNETRYGAGYSIADYRNVQASAEGRQLISSPKWKVTVSTEYSTPVRDGLDVFIQADMVYTSRIFGNATNDPILSVAGATIFGGRIGLRRNDQRWGISLFARNAFDTFRPLARFAAPAAFSQLDPLAFAQFVGPESNRIVGISLDSRF